MDDIDIGVESPDQARKLDDLLHTRGVRLNTGKTKIVTSTDAVEHLAADENRSLTLLGNLVELLTSMDLSTTREAQTLRKRTNRWMRSPRNSAWSKVVKRCLIFLGKLGDPYLVK